MNINDITEIELQAAGLDKMWWTFGGSSVYKDSNNTYMVDKGLAWFHYRNN